MYFFNKPYSYYNLLEAYGIAIIVLENALAVSS